MRKRSLSSLLTKLAVIGALSLFADSLSLAATPSYIQGNSADPPSQQTVVVGFSGAQQAGDLNVVVIAWDNAVALTSVTDQAGNVYKLVVGPTTLGTLSQSIYYCAGVVAAASNAVTVSFDGPALYPDIRIAEYSGIDPTHPLDLSATSSGTNATTSTGSIATTNAVDLLVAANYVETTTISAGPAFTSRMITQPDSNLLEDRVVTSTGSYGSSAQLDQPGKWIMQLAAFRASSTSNTASDTQPPTAPTNLSASAQSSSQVGLTWSASTDNVGVSGYSLERCAGQGCTAFATIASPSGASYADSGLLASTTYDYRVAARDSAGNQSGYSQATSVTTTSSAGGGGGGSTGSAPVFPLAASSNHRYLVDQTGAPVLLVGEGTAQMLAQRLPSVVSSYLDDRQAHGFNALWVHVIANNQDGANANGLTDDGIAPFTGTLGGTCDANAPCYDLTTPNPDYFARLDQILNIAAAHGMVVLLDTMENDSFLLTYRANGDARMTAYAQYLVNRYKSFPNIVWMTGNDFQTWSNTPSDNQLALDMMSTIAGSDAVHLQTDELNYNISGSLDDSLLVPYTSLPSAYTYYPAYYEVLQEYNSSARTAPVYLIESYYEGLSYGNLNPNTATNLMLRKIPYWTVLAGGLGGYFYGSKWWTFASGWQSGIDTLAATQLGYWKALFTALPWYNLVPDQSHSVVTAGYGTPTGNGTGNVQTDNYVTTAATPDGKLVVAYLPAGGAITVDMSKLSGTANAQWFDPSTGTYTAVSGSPFANTGKRTFTPTGKNGTGDPDWVLVLQAP